MLSVLLLLIAPLGLLASPSQLVEIGFEPGYQVKRDFSCVGDCPAPRFRYARDGDRAME